MTDRAPDQLVTLSDGRTMTWAQYQQVVTQQVAVFTQQMSTSIEQMSALAGRMEGGSGAASSALHTLMAEVSGIESAFGTDDQGNHMRSQWQKNVWPVVEQVMRIIPPNLHTFKASLDTAQDAFLAAER